MSEPTVIVVPGASIPKTSYASFLHALEKTDSHCQRDTAVIRNDVMKPLAEDQGQDAVVLMHSYASMPGSAAASGLLKAERARNGQAGGVMAAQLRPHSNLAFTSDQPAPAWAEPSYEGRCAYVVTGDDQAVPQAAQYGMIAATEKWIVKEMIGSSHMAPFLTKIDI
ncbi:hypothetical protein PISL3812_09419 [Talaromyces islandicus]|uniref:AB hydrolase-1 domain-containing protein n=1 Tax=Talaromyces islandicus TaxID=28573 RepID=A0A0U1MBB7_TALIS|nr:hypothetical protein PISL3812_09419 [Talaromyces islandicus]